MTWPSSPAELIVQQHVLATTHPPAWSPPPRPLRVAGCFACSARHVGGRGRTGDVLWSAAVVLERDSLEAHAVCRTVAGFPYEPGLLALRQGAALAEAVLLLPVHDVLLVDATGRDHPRRAGLALHLGAELDVPTVGVTHRPLVARGVLPATTRGSVSALMLDDERVGAWLRTARGARPVAVHAGWRVDVDTALAVVRASCRGFRTPGPLREARRIAREARASDRVSQ